MYNYCLEGDMKKNIYLLIFLSLLALIAPDYSYCKTADKKAEKNYEVKKILVSNYSGVIQPIASEYINDAIDKANKDGYDLFILTLDTPGGLDLSMREIIKKMMSSKIPVVVYIYPKGARAASAGVFITMASHIAAMSPSTNIGAAHPVMIGSGDFSDMKIKMKQEKSPMEEKVLNDAAAYIKSITQQKNRNSDWAIKAVTKSDSISAVEAVEKKVVDFMAEDLNDLIKKMNGYSIDGFGILKISDAKIDYFNKSKRQDFLSTITDPNIAMLLMSIGAIGIFIELYNPGLILPGVVGAISMVLGLYSFQTLSVNYAGLALILLGFIFFIAEIKVMSYGLLSVGAVISIVLGSVMLFNNPDISGVNISMKILISNLVGILIVVAILAYIVMRAQIKKVATGIESLTGKKGIAKTKLSPTGKVFVEGEIWDAISISGDIEENSEIVVDKVENFKLIVKKSLEGL
jgi:membrane-bound serine protease (ClpP class)